MSKTVEALQVAFTSDPNAIHALIVNRVPCNQFLADDPFVQVDQSPVLPSGNWQVGAIGLVNAVLAANGLPLVAAKFSEEKDTDGRSKLVGFCEGVELSVMHVKGPTEEKAYYWHCKCGCVNIAPAIQDPLNRVVCEKCGQEFNWRVM